MIRGTKEYIITELYRLYPAVIRAHGTTPEYFFTSVGTFEEQITKSGNRGKIIFFRLNPKTSALSLEQEEFEITL